MLLYTYIDVVAIDVNVGKGLMYVSDKVITQDLGVDTEYVADISNAEGIGYKSTIFDDAFKTECEKLKPLLIPLINEIFGTEYNISVVEIDRLANEHHAALKDGSDIKRITDACLKIGDILYHIECQSTEDGEILIRLVRYNAMIAIEDIRYDEDGRTLIVEYPRSALVRLRGKDSKLTYTTVEHRHDSEISREKITVMNVPAYSEDDIFEKELFFLVPFYPMRYEKELDTIMKNQLEMEPEYDKICLEMEGISKRLDEEVGVGRLTENMARDLRVLARSILEYISRKLDEGIKGRLVNSMGGRILELPSDQLRRERTIGYNEGEARGEDKKTVNVIRNMLLRGQEDEDIIGIVECTQEQIDRVRENL